MWPRNVERFKLGVEYFGAAIAVCVASVALVVLALWHRSTVCLALLSGLVLWGTVLCRAAATPRRRDAEVTAPERHLHGYEDGKQLVMGFRRQPFTWTSDHIPGTVLQTWELRMDRAGDKVFQPGMCCMAWERALSEAASMPEWVDWALLDEGCRFFVQTWPFVFYGFSWAVMGGFGAESASAVLLQSRYWAAMGKEGRRDSWLRLRETACWLFDMAAHGGQSFRPGGTAWRACLYVRYLHCRTRASIKRSGKWDVEKYGEPVNQAQLTGTLLGSSTLLLQGMEEMAGRPLPHRKREAFIHLWRVIGFLFGIDDDVNPNRSFEHSKVAMESLFSFGIAASPDPALTGNLTKHIIQSIAEGARQDYKVSISPGIVAMPAWEFLGEAYGAAIGLPSASKFERVVGRLRLFTVTLLLRLYLLPGAPAVYERVMRWTFQQVVRSIQRGQPACRFGALPGSCPMQKWKGGDPVEESGGLTGDTAKGG